MTDFYMGHELGAQELPLGTPPPPITPPDGVIISRVEPDGWTRKYLYKSKREMSGKIVDSSLLISEHPPKGPVVRQEVPIETHQTFAMPPVLPPPVQPRHDPLQPPPIGQTVKPIPLMATGRVPGRSGPFQPIQTGELSITNRPVLGQANLPMLANAPGRNLKLGQAAPPPAAPSTQPPAGSEASAPAQLPPPGPMQLPDGRVIQLDDPITLEQLWQMLPYILKCAPPGTAQAPPGPPQAQAPVPGGPIPVQPANGAGFPGFGPSTGAFGQGGFQGQGGGGGGGGGLPGPLGPVSPNIPLPVSGGGGGPGPAGPAGPPGPPGAGSGVDFLVKTDGDFTAGPGAFVPVPGTLLSFVQAQTGPVIFLINAVLGCDGAQNDALAIRVDGTTIIPLQAQLFHTFVGGVDPFFEAASANYPMTLATGTHTVEIMLRGIGAGEFCSASGLGIPATIGATPDTPLTLTVIHQATGAAAPTAPIVVLDGIEKTDGNFSNPGVMVPVPGTSITFGVSTAGKAIFTVSANFTAFDAQFPAVHLGIRIDGVDQELCYTREQQGAGDDHVEKIHMSGTHVVDLAVGSHTAQMLYGCDGGGTLLMDLEANTTRPAVLSVIHT